MNTSGTSKIRGFGRERRFWSFALDRGSIGRTIVSDLEKQVATNKRGYRGKKKQKKNGTSK